MSGVIYCPLTSYLLMYLFTVVDRLLPNFFYGDENLIGTNLPCFRASYLAHFEFHFHQEIIMLLQNDLI